MSTPAADPAVSVLMPAYNAARYLEQAVRSILGQGFDDLELLVIDDGSDDDTPALLRRLAEADPRLHALSRPNAGIVATRNQLLAMARGELLAVMDSDDVAEPGRIARQVDYLRNHPECVAVGSAVLVIDPQGDPLCVWNDDVSTHEQIDALHLEGHRGAVLCQPSVTMRAEAVRAVGGFRRRFEPAEDLDLYLRLAEVGRLANLPEPLLRYRMLPSSASHSRKREQVDGIRAAIEEAYRRRGLPAGPLPEPPSDEDLRLLADPSHNRALWGWWALRAGHVGSARKHARARLAERPLSPQSWRFLYCALRGR
ncbi:glycosyltransferase family 2 protein [Tautonia plasticadhaerens]|uniref:Glycosyltransferase EpsE n=1 Tax=Tautonia plasticadhaerens TaxID=2527974 RepID=A0A518HFL4_9BACT|nr:glycosyltransferase [Tautonia plasticadhaerens]QDV39639.1 Putative glycosyltransferase EpsE [Tautonia plasticadhaerens]